MNKKLAILLLVAVTCITSLFAADSYTVMNTGSTVKSNAGFHVDFSADIEGMFLYRTRTYSTYWNGWKTSTRTTTQTVAADMLYRAAVDLIYSFDGKNSVFAGGYIKYYYKPKGAMPDYFGGRLGVATDFSNSQSFTSETGLYVYGGYYPNLKITDAGIGVKGTIGAIPVGSFKVAANLFVEYPIIFAESGSKAIFFPTIIYMGAGLTLGF